MLYPFYVGFFFIIINVNCLILFWCKSFKFFQKLHVRLRALLTVILTAFNISSVKRQNEVFPIFSHPFSFLLFFTPHSTPILATPQLHFLGKAASPAWKENRKKLSHILYVSTPHLIWKYLDILLPLIFNSVIVK